jgi:hypothetical protein
MATDFNNKAMMSKPMYVGSSAKNDLPLDIRTRIETIDEMSMIQYPYIGMMVYVKDEDKFYVVKSLKGEEIVPGIAATLVENYRVDEYEELEFKGTTQNPVFDNLQAAQEHALSESSFHGQLLFVKDARTQEEKDNEVGVYDDVFYVDYYRQLKTICPFNEETMVLLIDILHNMNNGVDMTEEIAELKAKLLSHYTYDFRDYPEE